MTVLATLVSTDSKLVAELVADPAWEDALNVARDFAAAVRELDERTAVFVADLRDIGDGGHAADRQLDRLHESHPDLPVVVLTNKECPEPVERQIACYGLTRICGLRDGAELADCLEQFIDVRAPAGPVVNSVPVGQRPVPVIGGCGPDDGAEIVLEGVTRRYETNSPQLKKMLGDLAVAASHDVTILLIGETGSGKTYLSNLIHEASPRRDEPFLHVACGALPSELIESELFGHVRGAFTSAHADKQGKFLAAGKGTVLLDEIDVLGPEQQVKLLKVIETGEFEPVGSNTTHQSQARLVVASNLDLEPLVEQAKFRPDLYYRLNMLKFEIPPLRKRKMDILPLAKKFVRRFEEKHSLTIERIDDAFYDGLLSYPWPGNVRELEHVIQRAVIYARDGELAAAQLPPHILSGVAGPANDPSVKLSEDKEDSGSLDKQIAVTEKEIIEQTLYKNNFSRTNTAKELGISRVTLYNKMKKYQMQ